MTPDDIWPDRGVDLASGCVEWAKYRDRDGYGITAVNRKTCKAHRLAYERAKGPIPEGLVIDHLCRNRACVNPDHLEAVTNYENHRRGLRANQTHCKRGHPLSGPNLRRANGRRHCKACARVTAIKRRESASPPTEDQRRRHREREKVRRWFAKAEALAIYAL